MQLKNRIKILCLLLIPLAIIAFENGCGEKTTLKIDSSGDTEKEVDKERDTGAIEEDEEEEEKEAVLGECNVMESDDEMDFIAVTKTYYGIDGAKYVPDQIDMEIRALPSSIQGTDSYIEFYRMALNDDNEIIMNTTPVEFQFIRRPQKFLSRRSFIGRDETQLSEDLIEDLAKKSFITAGSFFNSYGILLKGIDSRYKSIMAILTNDDASRTVIQIANDCDASECVETLIPPFSASPKIYEENNLDYFLKLHPMYSRIKSGLSEKQFQEAIHNKCQTFFEEI